MNSSVPSPQITPPTDHHLLKVGAVLTMVVLGHMASLWLVSKMKAPELQPPKPTKPVQVKFVTLQPPPPPPPPPPKPKPQPKQAEAKPKEVKIVEQPKPQPKPVTPPPPVPPAPKIVATPKPAPAKPSQPVVQQREVIKEWKPTPKQDPKQTIKEMPKEVPKELPKDPPKEIVKEPAPVQKAEPKPEPKPEPVKAEPKTEPKPEPKPVVSNTPRNVSAGSLAWSRRPAPKVTESEFKSSDPATVSVTVRFSADANGRVTNASIAKSSGNSTIDNRALSAVKGAKLQPYKENGVAVPITSSQSFVFNNGKKKADDERKKRQEEKEREKQQKKEQKDDEKSSSEQPATE